jgi:hypothetical protein
VSGIKGLNLSPAFQTGQPLYFSGSDNLLSRAFFDEIELLVFESEPLEVLPSKKDVKMLLSYQGFEPDL